MDNSLSKESYQMSINKIQITGRPGPQEAIALISSSQIQTSDTGETKQGLPSMRIGYKCSIRPILTEGV